MAKYLNCRCPKCGFSFTHGYSVQGYNSGLGLPYLRCPVCKTIVRTSNNIFSKMSNKQKGTYIISRVFQATVNAFGVFGGILIIINSLTKLNEFMSSPVNVVFIIITSLIISTLIIYFIEKRNIRILEEAYKHLDKDYYFDIN